MDPNVSKQDRMSVILFRCIMDVNVFRMQVVITTSTGSECSYCLSSQENVDVKNEDIICEFGIKSIQLLAGIRRDEFKSTNYASIVLWNIHNIGIECKIPFNPERTYAVIEDDIMACVTGNSTQIRVYGLN